MYEVFMDLMLHLIAYLVGLIVAVKITVLVVQKLSKCQHCGRRGGLYQVTWYVEFGVLLYGLRCRHCGELQMLRDGDKWIDDPRR